MTRLLLERWPALSKFLDIEVIADLPTPVEKYKNTTAGFDNISNLWIKRDDLTHNLYGGNKIRKLEFIIGDVKKQKKSKIVTMGALGTNHGVATSIITQLNGMDSRIYLFDQPLTPHVKNNLQTMIEYGADLQYRKSIAKSALSYYSSRLLDRDCYHLPAGGSNIMGCLAFVNAALELDNQIKIGEAPPIDIIVCPVGSSGTIAGLTLGFALINSPIKVMGVRVAPSHLGPIPICTQKTVRSLMLKTYRYMRRCDPQMASIIELEVWLNNDYYGDGYGHPTKKSDTAQSRFIGNDYPLEPTYTSKAAAAAFDLCQLYSQSNILYWHTLNSRDIKNPMSKTIGRNIDQRLIDYIR